LSLAFLAADAALAAALTPASSADLQRRANGVLMIMGYSLTPDVTTGSLSISNQSTGNPGLSMVSLGGGDVFSKGRDESSSSCSAGGSMRSVSADR
jgi:hypothetical protein